jgi:hypothetical protein
MNLFEISDETATTEWAFNYLKNAMSEHGINVVRTSKHIGLEGDFIVVNPEKNGERFIDALLDVDSRQLADDAAEEEDPHGESEEAEWAWVDTMSDLGHKAVEKFTRFIPKGWRITDVDDWYDMDPYNFKYKITLERDEDPEWTRHPTRIELHDWRHVTLAKNLPRIKKEGLKLHGSKHSSSVRQSFAMGTYRDKIFLFTPEATRDDVTELARMLQSQVVGDVIGSGFIADKLEQVALLKVDVSDYKKYTDPDYPKGAYVTKSIPPSKIEVEFVGDIKDLQFQ